ncbi:hypothetical protein T4D_530 [Trichinella pseudospiralis]|uniref:Uncharacterized protein n=1 Tax=Trichinella pseudospiralis TaxID=6337 RepID=A0A0V1G4I9_TRIPS|nr:hypothetical protein T4D_530 [Trichinella pseudospiralis]
MKIAVALGESLRRISFTNCSCQSTLAREPRMNAMSTTTNTTSTTITGPSGAELEVAWPVKHDQAPSSRKCEKDTRARNFVHAKPTLFRRLIDPFRCRCRRSNQLGK